MDPAGDHTCTITAERSHRDIDSAKQKIASYLTKNNIHTDVVSAVELSTYEALVNITDHQPARFRDRLISIACSISGRCISVTISYDGKKFDMTKTDLPDIVDHFRKGKKRGLGIYFIRTLMDTVEYIHERGRNTMTLTKNY
jgi:anti-sigma regulatory factor (Ser/Thr protein kinase)